jgi:Family of unknown function (DUF5868)
MMSASGMNTSACDVRDIDWKLHWWNSYNISDNEGIKFRDIVIACYKIKSHKFEIEYEKYN